MFLTLLTTLGLSLLCAPAQQLQPGQTAQLSKTGAGPSDHSSLALNSYGDVCVAYQTRQSSGQRLVEAYVLRYEGASTWSSGRTQHVILGDPAVGLYGPLLDTCTKPSVIALDDGSFIVAWPRSNLQDKSVGQLEVARVEIRDLAGTLLPRPLVSSAAAGLGFVLDPLVASGDAGVMPDLAPLPGGGAVAVYASELWRTEAGNGEVWRDYELRAVAMDWAAGPADPAFSPGPVLLTSGLPMDSDPWTTFSGGMVLPDVVADDDQNLVVAWEQYRLQGRPGYASYDLGEVMVSRYAAFSSAAPLALLDQSAFANDFPNLQQRRPCLSASRADSANTVLLAWVSINRPPYGSMDVFFKEILYAPVAGQSIVSNRYWINDAWRDEAHPVPVQGSVDQRCFGTRQYPNRRIIMGTNDAAQSAFQILSPIKFPERVSTEIFETLTPQGAPLSLLLISYEGSDYNNPDLYRVYVGVFTL